MGLWLSMRVVTCCWCEERVVWRVRGLPSSGGIGRSDRGGPVSETGGGRVDSCEKMQDASSKEANGGGSVRAGAVTQGAGESR